jgi:hypothetical protein
MAAFKRGKTKKKLFTPTQANAMLPLLRSILRDVTELAHELHDRQERLRAAKGGSGAVDQAHWEELEAEFERGRERMHQFLDELDNLGIELKDPFVGLIDFRCKLEGREVYLCWRMDEPEVAHWHELNTGFSSRQKLLAPAISH